MIAQLAESVVELVIESVPVVRRGLCKLGWHYDPRHFQRLMHPDDLTFTLMWRCPDCKQEWVD